MAWEGVRMVPRGDTLWFQWPHFSSHRIFIKHLNLKGQIRQPPPFKVELLAPFRIEIIIQGLGPMMPSPHMDDSIGVR